MGSRMIYAVIDTNVLVSAMLKWNSVPGCVIEQTYDRQACKADCKSCYGVVKGAMSLR